MEFKEFKEGFVRLSEEKGIEISIIEILKGSECWDELLSCVKEKSRRFYRVLGTEFKNSLLQIDDSILVENQIYIDKKDVVQKKGIALFFNSKSRHFSNSESTHYDNSESYHFGNSVSTHYGNSVSYHYGNSVSYHFDNSKSTHFGNSKSRHFGNSESTHYGNSVSWYFDNSKSRHYDDSKKLN